MTATWLRKSAVALSVLAIQLTVVGTATPQANEERLAKLHKGIILIALPPSVEASDDIRTLDGAEGIERLAAAYDALISASPRSRTAIERLKADGIIQLHYLPRSLPRSPVGGEGIALLLPHFSDSYGLERGKRSYIVGVGRRGIQWSPKELAAVLAHELAGHGIQLLEGRLQTMRDLDRECEAFLVGELANQDLGLDKYSRFLVKARQMMERHFCLEFKDFMKSNHPDDLALWERLNPDVPRLLTLFGEYLRDSVERGLTGKALAADERLLKEERGITFERGSPEQIHGIGWQFWNGIGVQVDRSEAMRWFLQAAAVAEAAGRDGHSSGADSKVAFYQSHVGRMYEELGEVRKAFTWYRRAAEKGEPRAQANLGRMYLRAIGVDRDYAKAGFWLERSASQGDKVAMFGLGIVLEFGMGRDKDLQAAADWYRRSAEQGFARADYRLGRLHYLGSLGSKNLPTAIALFRKAAAGGYAAAQNMLGWLYLHGKGLTKDYAEARALLESAAKQGYVKAYFNLGTIHRDGLGVVRDYRLAMTWFQRAAAQDHAPAMHRLGWMYTKGEGVPADPTQAVTWFQASAERGHGSSLLRLGKIFAEGIGVEKDLVQAYVWYRIAETQNVKGAARARARLEMSLTAEQSASAEEMVDTWKPEF